MNAISSPKTNNLKTSNNISNQEEGNTEEAITNDGANNLEEGLQKSNSLENSCKSLSSSSADISSKNSNVLNIQNAKTDEAITNEGSNNLGEIVQTNNALKNLCKSSSSSASDDISLKNSKVLNIQNATASVVEIKSQQTDKDNLVSRQLISAKKSLETNLLILVVFFFLFAILIMLPNREFFSVLAFTVLKGAMPLLTTIVNFGTVQSVMRQYCEYIGRKTNCFGV
jgi:hypothetical protein